MEIENYPSNSHKSKEVEEKRPEKNVTKVVSGTARKRKRGSVEKLADVFLPEDIHSVRDYVIRDVIIPKVKDVLHDIGSEAWDSFWGISGRSHRVSTASRVSYDRFSTKQKPTTSSIETRTRTGYSYDNVVLDNRGEAEEVLTRMDELIETYGVVTVADLYDLVGITCQYTDNKYGWTNIRNASVVRIREGYAIKMPKALPID